MSEIIQHDFDSQELPWGQCDRDQKFPLTKPHFLESDGEVEAFTQLCTVLSKGLILLRDEGNGDSTCAVTCGPAAGQVWQIYISRYDNSRMVLVRPRYHPQNQQPLLVSDWLELHSQGMLSSVYREDILRILSTWTNPTLTRGVLSVLLEKWDEPRYEHHYENTLTRSDITHIEQQLLPLRAHHILDADYDSGLFFAFTGFLERHPHQSFVQLCLNFLEKVAMASKQNHVLAQYRAGITAARSFLDGRLTEAELIQYYMAFNHKRSLPSETSQSAAALSELILRFLNPKNLSCTPDATEWYSLPDFFFDHIAIVHPRYPNNFLDILADYDMKARKQNK